MAALLVHLDKPSGDIYNGVKPGSVSPARGCQVLNLLARCQPPCPPTRRRLSLIGRERMVSVSKVKYKIVATLALIPSMFASVSAQMIVVHSQSSY